MKLVRFFVIVIVSLGLFGSLGCKKKPKNETKKKQEEVVTDLNIEQPSKSSDDQSETK